MTVAWALIIIAILFLLDKHVKLKQALIAVAGLALVAGLGIGIYFAYQLEQPKWQTYQWKRHHECFDPSTDKTVDVRGNEQSPCDWDEIVYERNATHAAAPKCDDAPRDPFFVIYEIQDTDKRIRYWQNGNFCVPTHSPLGDGQAYTMDGTPQPRAIGLPYFPYGSSVKVILNRTATKFGNASCVGRRYVKDYRQINSPEYGDKHCDMLVGDPHNLEGMKREAIPDGERLQVSGRSEALIRSRGGSASNVNQAGPWAGRTLAETAQKAVNGDSTAETAIKIAKQAGRLGQQF